MIRRSAIAAIAIGAAILVGGAITAAILALSDRGPRRVVLEVRVDPNSEKAVAKALEGYNGRQGRFIASIAGDEDAADLVLGPYAEGSILWRSVGWRLWARLETLAALEGDWHRPIIRLLRSGSVGVEEFEALLSDIEARGIAPLILPTAPPAYEAGLRRYLDTLGEDLAGKLDVGKGGHVVAAPNIASALDALKRGKAAFIVGSDAVGELLGRSTDLHPEGFPLPGSAAKSGGWAIGRAEGFTFKLKPKEKGPTAGALDLVAYLTSLGLTRVFAAELPGTYYSWSSEPATGEAPKIDGPARFIDPEK